MIKLSKKGDYAVKTVVFLANNQQKEIFKIAEISKILNISESLLRRIISELEKSQIIKSIKWRNWGILIGKDFEKISVFDILEAVWEELGIADCTKWINCERKSCCETTDIYNLLQKWFNGVLKIYTLDKITKKLEK